MFFDNSLFEYDAGYYEFLPGRWLAGKPVPGSGVRFDRETVRQALEVELHDTDVLIATYPKTGQTWTMTIIHCILLQAKKLQQGEDLSLQVFYEQIPFMEAEFYGERGAYKFNKLTPPRFMKTHLPYELWRPQLDKHPNLRVIQILRNPKDTLVSWYHHYRANDDLGRFNGTWDQFFELFKQKKLSWGDFFENNSEWYKFNRDRENSLILRYEDMKRDPRTNILRIAKFIGCEVSEKLLDLTIEKSSVESMSKPFNSLYTLFPSWDIEKSTFIRKGVVGDWKNYFTEEQSRYVDEQCKKYLEPLGITFDYDVTDSHLK